MKIFGHDLEKKYDIWANSIETALQICNLTLASHCSEMALLSDWTSGQSTNRKKESKLLSNAFQIIYFILILIDRWIRFLKNHLTTIFGSKGETL